MAAIFPVAVGIVARTIIPFLQELRDHPDTPFDRKFLVPPLISIIIALVGLPLLLAQVPPEMIDLVALTLGQWVTLFLIGWGGTDLVREGQKLLGGK